LFQCHSTIHVPIKKAQTMRLSHHVDDKYTHLRRRRISMSKRINNKEIKMN